MRPILATIGIVVSLAAAMVGGRIAVGTDGSDHRTMTGSNFGLIRREALDLHPIGSKVAAVASSLDGLGFRCHRRAQMVINVSAPTVTCDSNGRGGSASSHIALTLVARNDSLMDVSVSDGFDPMQASARTPDPKPKGELPRPAPRPVMSDPEWNQILENAAAKLRSVRQAPRLAQNLAGVSGGR